MTRYRSALSQLAQRLYRGWWLPLVLLNGAALSQPWLHSLTNSTNHATSATLAPNFTFKHHDQNTTLQQAAQQAWVYVDFWASWCVPCRDSFVFMNQLQQQFSERGLLVVAVNLDKNPDDARAFLQAHPAQFLIHYDPSNQIATDFKVRGMPSSYLVHQGKVVFKHVGFNAKKSAALMAEIERYLAPTPLSPHPTDAPSN
ncbi:MAG: redoxin domain-containing protein [Ferrimonas sp.]